MPQVAALSVHLFHVTLGKPWCSVISLLIIIANHAPANQTTLFTLRTEAVGPHVLMDTSIPIIHVKAVFIISFVLKTKDLSTAPQSTSHFVQDAAKAKNIWS